MASTNDVIFLESMADFLSNPVDIRLGSMPAESIAPAACLVVEGNAVTSDQQIETDLLLESHPPTPSDLIAGINRVEDMLSNTIKVCERIKRPRRTSSPSSMPLGLRNAAHVASRLGMAMGNSPSGNDPPSPPLRGTEFPAPVPASANEERFSPIPVPARGIIPAGSPSPQNLSDGCHHRFTAGTRAKPPPWSNNTANPRLIRFKRI
jgi:hypothetical protein